jgi:hypothetical protein
MSGAVPQGKVNVVVALLPLGSYLNISLNTIWKMNYIII